MASLSAVSPDGVPIEIPQSAVAALRASLRGALLLPGEAPYDESRSVWNAMIDRRPALVARCLGVSDVRACVEFATAQGVSLCVKGGGHNIAGLAVASGALMIDLGLQRGVLVDPGDRSARVQGGCLLGDVDRETQLHGLAAVLGFVSATGVAGLTLGGGFGYLTRRFGWTSDTVRSIRLVAADGRLVRASETENADLFWGLRGGGGNFGVVTEIEFALHGIGPEITAGAVAWRLEDADAVLDLYCRLAAEAPPELTLVAVMRRAPAAPWLETSVHGRPIVAIFACHSGDLAEGRRLLAPVKGHGTPVGDNLQKRTYVSQQSLLDATQPKGRRYYWKSEYLPRIDRELLAAGLEQARRMPSPHSAIVFFPLDGALNRLPDGHSAVGNRDAGAVVNVTGSWERKEEDEANVAWTREAWSELRRFSTGGTYVNFLTEEENGERLRAAYGTTNLERLAAVKARWDKANLFRANKNIAPAAGPA